MKNEHAEIKVSVIVPVYNAQETLAAALSNLVHQTLKEIEILLVDDASTDGSRRIMEDCLKQFPDRIRILSAGENKGPGGARNLGLDAARGAYVGFVDADDAVDTRMYQLLYEEALRTGADMVDTGFLDVKRDRAIVFTGDDCTGTQDAGKRSALIVSGGYLWSRLFRRSLFEDPAPLRFREGVILEDADVLTYLLATVRTVANVKEILYKYNDQAGSASKKEADPSSYHRNIMAAMRAIHDRVYMLPGYEDIRDAVEYEILQMYSYGVNNCVQAKRNGTLPAREADAMRRELCVLRRETVRCRDYADNRYVMQKIPEADRRLMREADAFA